MDRRRLLGLIGLSAALPAVARASSGGEKKKSGGGSYVPIETLLGTTTRANGRRGVLTVDCGLDVPDSNLRNLTEQSVPRLRAAYAQVVQTYAAGLTPGPCLTQTTWPASSSCRPTACSAVLAPASCWARLS